MQSLHKWISESISWELQTYASLCYEMERSPFGARSYSFLCSLVFRYAAIRLNSVNTSLSLVWGKRIYFLPLLGVCSLFASFSAEECSKDDKEIWALRWKKSANIRVEGQRSRNSHSDSPGESQEKQTQNRKKSNKEFSTTVMTSTLQKNAVKRADIRSNTQLWTEFSFWKSKARERRVFLPLLVRKIFCRALRLHCADFQALFRRDEDPSAERNEREKPNMSTCRSAATLLHVSSWTQIDREREGTEGIQSAEITDRATASNDVNISSYDWS